jgi:hypothetical protein
MAWYNDIFNFSKPQPQKANIRKTIDFEQQLQRVRQDATRFNIALQSAESPMYPNRFLLMQTYQQIVLDGQVQSAMLQRKSKILCKRFMVYGPDGECDEAKTELFNQKWFYDFQNLALDSIFWGFCDCWIYFIFDICDIINYFLNSTKITLTIFYKLI